MAEDWKDAATLCAVDRGGQIMVPKPGIYEDVVACDFSGYYPSLVVAHNLSSDTINCACCPDGPLVPELGYHVCKRHAGHQSEILRRLQPHRRYVKAVLKRADALGEHAILTGEPRPHNAVVDATVELLCLQKSDFEALLSLQPTMAVQVSRLLASRLLETTRAKSAGPAFGAKLSDGEIWAALAYIKSHWHTSDVLAARAEMTRNMRP